MKNTFGNLILFEIPIYSMTKRSFLEKWENKIKKLLPLYDSLEFERINNSMHQYYRKNMLWHYNQIIGYITVNVHGNDITFSVYKSLNQRIRYDSSKKNLIEDLMCLGTHFYVKNYNDEELIAEIKSWVSEMIKEYVKKPLYIDTSLFDAMIDSIDLKKLINIRKAQNGENGL